MLRNGKPHPVDVTTGLRDNAYVEITGGALAEGDEVIVNEVGQGSGSPAPAARRLALRF